MASPFNIFRKRQRMLLVVIGVLCIFVFTVGDIILQWFGPDTTVGREVETVVTWKGGDLDQDELAALRTQHNLTIAYLSQVVSETLKKEGSPKGAGVTRNRQGQIMDPGISADDSDLRLVRTLLLAEEAEKLGMEIPDLAIIDFLADLSDSTLSSEELRNLLHGATRGRLTRDQLFNHLRRELLARNYLRLAAAGDVMTPDDAWSYYNRLTRRIDASLVEFRAEDYLDKAPQPTEEQIRELYEEYKDQFPFPGSPEPGFKERAQFEFAYFKSNYDKFMEEEKAKISAEEVQTHYEENKEQYTVPELPDLPDVKTPPEKIETEKTEETPEAKAKETESPADAPAEEKPEGDAPAEPAVEEVKPSPEAPKEESPEPPAESDPPQPEDSSSLQQDAQFLVAFQPPAESDAVTEEPASDAEPAAPADESEAKQPAEDAEPKEAPADPEAEKPETPATEEAEKTHTPATEEPEKEAEYQPLSEVEDDIRRTLAADAVRERIDAALSEAERAVKRYGRSYRNYVNRPEGAKGRKPQKPDFEELAQRLGLTYERTPLVDALTVGETELGQTFTRPTRESIMMTGSFQGIPFVQIAMQSEEALLYEPKRISGGFDEYLYWPTGIEPSHTPPLEEVRDDVVRAWRLKQAFEIAKRQAEQAAEKVRKAPHERPLGEVLSLEEAEIIQPPAFSWMSAGQSIPFGGGQPRMSDVEGVENPGDEFFRAAYALAPGEAGVAPNASKTAVYLIRVSGSTPSETVLRDMFWQGGVQFNPNLQYVARLEQQKKIFEWLEDLEKQWGLDWQRPPRG
ncbi:MAG: hypothetical protein KY475_00800 [Planctomycetes bacterium]|nr:hypothetical protein [Planctomycetota bacterium]